MPIKRLTASILAALSGYGLLTQTAHAQSAGAPASISLRSAIVTLKVTDFTLAGQQIRDAAAEQAATLEDARTTIDGSGRHSGWVRLRVPAGNLPGMLARIRGVGTLYAEKLKTEDDASQYDSLALRADRLQQHEARLGSVLTNERRLRGSDVLFVQERLFRASVDESLLRQERVDLARKARTSRLLVFLFEPAPTGARTEIRRSVSGQFAFARQRAVNAFTASLRRSVTALAWATVYAPIWLALSLVPLAVLLRLRAKIRPLRRLLAAKIYAPYQSRTESRKMTAELPPPAPSREL